MDIATNVIGSINDFFKQSDITRESHLFDDLYFDSLDFVELVMLMEEQFDCEIMDADAEQWKTVNDIIIYIEDKLNGKN